MNAQHMQPGRSAWDDGHLQRAYWRAYTDAHSLQYQTAHFLNHRIYFQVLIHLPVITQPGAKQTLGSAPGPSWLPWSSSLIIGSSRSRFQEMQTASKLRGYRNKRKRDVKTANRTIKRWKKNKNNHYRLNNLISSSFVVLRSTTREQEQNFIIPAVCSRVSCAIPSSPSLCCLHSRWVKSILQSDSTWSLWTAAPSPPS